MTLKIIYSLKRFLMLNIYNIEPDFKVYKAVVLVGYPAG